MRIRLSIAGVSALLLCACATAHEPGWSGEGATPFDSAQAQCRAEAPSADADADADTDTDTDTERAARFNDCMARHGWTRGRD